MNAMNKLNFRISSALKDLIGKELVTDKYVAIFELVKNAYDAGASYAKISFVNDESGKYKKIFIEDDGCGMDYEDLQKKWLFVGYSDKNTGQHSKNADYRDRFSSKRMLAGAKGVGRFSCDRLGRKLTLDTKKDGEKIIHEIKIDWGEFEKNALEEFSDVSFTYVRKNKGAVKEIGHGTIIEVSELRDVWDRDALLALKKHLMKLIHPNENDEYGFKIYIDATLELAADSITESSAERVNGQVHNFIFEKLGLKTTGIEVHISDDGREVRTILTDRGALIYNLLETKSKDYSLLRDIHVYIYQLNTEAKSDFTKLMKIQPVNFGSIFVYKNGFRIYPYGEPGDDTLGVDKRKQQGYKRNFGTREIIGRIEIRGTQPSLIETTSRSGGIIASETYSQLRTFFMNVCLRRLEKYAVDVVKWGELDSDIRALPELSQLEVSKKIFDIISRLAFSKSVINIEYSDDFIKVYNRLQTDRAAKLPDNLLDIARHLKDKDTKKAVRYAAANVKDLLQLKKEAQEAAKKLTKDNAALERDIERRRKQALFLSTISTPTTEELLRYLHAIITYSCSISAWIKLFNESKSDYSDRESFKNLLDGISEANQRTLLLSRFATRANFNTTAGLIRADVIQFIHEYLVELLSKIYARRIKLICSVNAPPLVVEYCPLEIGLAVENIISNSIKAKATQVEIVFEESKQCATICFTDNGKGLDPSISNVRAIFEKGYTTTNGSGLGLYNVMQSFSAINATVDVDASYIKGFRLIIQIPYEH